MEAKEVLAALAASSDPIMREAAEIIQHYQTTDLKNRVYATWANKTIEGLIAQLPVSCRDCECFTEELYTCSNVYMKARGQVCPEWYCNFGRRKPREQQATSDPVTD